MAAALVQFKTAASSSGALSLTFDNPTASGNAIILTVNGRAGASTPITYVCTDSNANTYTVAVSTGGAVATVQGGAMLYAYNIVGGGSHGLTVTTSNMGSGFAIIAYEFSGLTTTNPFDKKAGQQSFGGTITSTTTPTLIQADELVVAGANNRAGSILTAGSGYTLSTNQLGSQQAAGEYLLSVGSTDQVTATFTPNTTSANWVCTVATFTVAASTGAAAVFRNYLMMLGIT